MECTVAKSAGFCFGVKRAVDLAIEESKKEGPLYSLGPIIHNEDVVNDLKSQGVVTVDDLDELLLKEKGRVIIRSHGVGKIVYDKLTDAGFEILDATCPFVAKIHNYVREYTDKGYYILIIGSSMHPEVEGIKGWCNEGQFEVVENELEAEIFSEKKHDKLCVVSQTTFKLDKFKKLVEIIDKKGYHIDICILNTICNATEERQLEAIHLSSESDVMIVIGSKQSSNTRKLYEICADRCKDTYYIQTLEELYSQAINGPCKVGITAGASTPNKIIQEVQKYVRNEL